VARITKTLVPYQITYHPPWKPKMRGGGL